MKAIYTIEKVPGIIPRWRVLRDGVKFYSSASQEQAAAMRDASERAEESGADEFTRGYIEAAYFTDTGDLEQPSADAELAPEAMADAVADCLEFQQFAAAMLAEAYAHDYDAAQAGRDYWLTRNGHGAGYWDRDELRAGFLGRRLTTAAQSRGQCYLYSGDDGRLYFE